VIPNHSEFIEAVGERKKLRVSFYSRADDGVLDHVCAPIDYGPGGAADGLNRYWLWDYATRNENKTTGLMPQQIVGLHVLGEVFAPTDVGAQPWPFAVPRDWGSSS
jgi:hypothetical protein